MNLGDGACKAGRAGQCSCLKNNEGLWIFLVSSLSLSQLHQVGAIIITPTRELAKQIDEVLKKFTEDLSQLRLVARQVNKKLMSTKKTISLWTGSQVEQSEKENRWAKRVEHGLS